MISCANFGVTSSPHCLGQRRPRCLQETPVTKRNYCDTIRVYIMRTIGSVHVTDLRATFYHRIAFFLGSRLGRLQQCFLFTSGKSIHPLEKSLSNTFVLLLLVNLVWRERFKLSRKFPKWEMDNNSYPEIERKATGYNYLRGLYTVERYRP
jgi:hypothetical protein